MRHRRRAALNGAWRPSRSSATDAPVRRAAWSSRRVAVSDGSAIAPTANPASPDFSISSSAHSPCRSVAGVTTSNRSGPIPRHPIASAAGLPRSACQCEPATRPISLPPVRPAARASRNSNAGASAGPRSTQASSRPAQGSGGRSIAKAGLRLTCSLNVPIDERVNSGAAGRVAACATRPAHRKRATLAGGPSFRRSRPKPGPRYYWGVQGPEVVGVGAPPKVISTRRFCGSRTPSAVSTSGRLSPKASVVITPSGTPLVAR